MSRFALRVLQLSNADQVQETMKKIGVDSAGIARMADKAQWVNILVANLPCGAANILKQEMLAIGADAAVARGTVTCSLKHTDVLLMATLKQFAQLIERLPCQPFGLPDLAIELQQLLATAVSRPKLLQGKDCCLNLDRPQVMAVLNVTPDSFYDGGKSFSVDSALLQVEQQIADGADIIDIGGESTRPGAPLVDVDTELERIIPVVNAVRSSFSIPISVDTNKATVAARAIEAGANFINDISGLTFDTKMAEVVADSGAGLFVMHTRGCPEVMQRNTVYADLIGDIISSLSLSLQTAHEAGIATDKLAVDPGIGFGKSVAGNLEILRRLSELQCLGCPILLGTSRKSFIGELLHQPQPQQRLFGSVGSAVVGFNNGAQLFRVHDVAPTRQALDIAWSVCASNF
ncbi:MAG: dihydropteroate synthase [Desulfuromonas sp.]|nr:dihydropteroate synthase [Desulfuromonas sp.]